VPIRRRRPLLRAAAVGGGAYYMGKRRAQGQGPPAGPPADEAPASGSPASSGMSAEAVQRLQEIAELHKQGVLTDEEFAAQKARILG
jgi:Short C-terminal domain